MSIESLYADRIEEAVQRRLRNPPPVGAPTFNLWSALGAVGTGPAAAGFETAGTLSDILSGFGTAAAASGGTGQGMFSVPTPDEAKQEAEARDRMLKGDSFNPSVGNELRRKADEMGPDPATSHKANQVIFGLAKGVSKAVADVGLMGPVAGPIAFGTDEANTTYQRLRSEGVDDATAAKVAGVTGVVQGAGLAIPVVGPTVAKTLGLAALAGPASYMTQEALTKKILQRADYGDMAAQHDPLDPLGLALSVAIPGVAAGLHIRGLTKTPALADVVKHIESGGKRFDENGNLLTSPKGAQGEMQVMPKTATDPGFGVAPAKDNSPEELARVGRDYLTAMQQRYNDPEKALAAYNAGPGAVDKAIKAHGEDWLAHMPEETQKYVAKADKMLGDHVAGKAAEDPAVIDAARVRVLDDTVAKSLPDHPEAMSDLRAAMDDVAAGRTPVVEVPARLDVTSIESEARQLSQDFIASPTQENADWGGNIDHHLDALLESRPDLSTRDAHGISGSDALRRLENLLNEGIDQRRDFHTVAVADRGGMLADRVNNTAPFVVLGRGDGARIKDAGIQTVLVNGGHAFASQRLAEAHPGVEFIDATTGQSHVVAPGQRIQRQAANAGEREATATLPPETRPTIEPEKAPAASSEKEPGAVDQARLKTLIEERPDLKVKLPGSDETISAEEALVRAHEQYDADVSEKNLIQAAIDCFLGG